jgi:hypothetical protein
VFTIQVRTKTAVDQNSKISILFYIVHMKKRFIYPLLLLALASIAPAMVGATPSSKPAKAAGPSVESGQVEVRGKLTAKGYKAPPDPDAPKPRYYWEIENGIKEVTPDRISPDREISVVLLSETPPSGEFNAEVTFTGGSLMPSTVMVRANSTLEIRNLDEIGHELYAGDLSAFSAETIAPRGVRTVRLSGAGKWPLRDKLVAHVRGYLYVLDNLSAVAKVFPDGEFLFSKVVAGKYLLKVFYGPHELVSREVEIAAQEKVLLDPVPLAGPAKSK